MIAHERISRPPADVDMIGEGPIETAFVGQVERLRTQAAYLKFHAALRELPNFTASTGTGHDPRSLSAVRICPSEDYFRASWDDASHGRYSRCPVMSIQIPTVYDPTLAPPGQHVMSIWVQYAPVHLVEGSWDD